VPSVFTLVAPTLAMYEKLTMSQNIIRTITLGVCDWHIVCKGASHAIKPVNKSIACYETTILWDCVVFTAVQINNQLLCKYSYS